MKKLFRLIILVTITYDAYSYGELIEKLSLLHNSFNQLAHSITLHPASPVEKLVVSTCVQAPASEAKHALTINKLYKTPVAGLIGKVTPSSAIDLAEIDNFFAWLLAQDSNSTTKQRTKNLHTIESNLSADKLEYIRATLYKEHEKSIQAIKHFFLIKYEDCLTQYAQG